MEGRRCNFEGEPDQGHGNAGKQQWRKHLSVQLVRDGRKTGSASDTINEAEPKKGERTCRTAEEKILQAGFGRTNVGLVKGCH